MYVASTRGGSAYIYWLFGLLTITMPALTSASAMRANKGFTASVSPRSTADIAAPKTGVMNPKMLTRLTGFAARSLDQRVYAIADIKPI